MKHDDKSIRYLYITDQVYSQRVVTLARVKIDSNTLRFSWSINRISVFLGHTVSDNNVEEKSECNEVLYSALKIEVHDRYNKLSGKKAAAQRLSKPGYYLEVDISNGERPIQAMFQKILCTPSSDPHSDIKLNTVPPVLKTIIQREMRKLKILNDTNPVYYCYFELMKLNLELNSNSSLTLNRAKLESWSKGVSSLLTQCWNNGYKKSLLVNNFNVMISMINSSHNIHLEVLKTVLDALSEHRKHFPDLDKIETRVKNF